MKHVKWIFILFLAMVAVVFCVLFTMSHLPQADQFQAATDLAAPPDKVWAFLDDEQNLKKWVSWLVDVKRTGPRGVGSKLTLTMQDANNGDMLIKIDSFCTEYIPGEKMTETVSSSEYHFNGSVTYRLISAGQGRTRMDVDSEYHFAQWYADMMSPLIMPAARNKLKRDLDRLKAVVEKL
ncbi:MAG: SRPBCC family protein [Acidobacteriota bacterium]